MRPHRAPRFSCTDPHLKAPLSQSQGRPTTENRPLRPMLHIPDPFDEATLRFVYTFSRSIRHGLAMRRGGKRLPHSLRPTPIEGTNGGDAGKATHNQQENNHEEMYYNSGGDSLRRRD